MGEHGLGPERGFGVRLRSYREAAGLTQDQLAEQAGLSVAAVQDIEQGRTTRPRSASVTRLAQALHLRGDQHAELAALAAPVATPGQRPPARSGNGQSRLRLELLGPVAAWRDEAPVALGPVRQRAVLALLVLHAEAGLSRSAIIDALWNDDPPETAVTMVQGYITRIRRLLGPGDGSAARSGVLWWDGALYRVAPGAVDSDLAEFTELAERAQQAASGDPLHACQLYEQAVRLWRGEPVADIELLHGHPAVIELSQRRAAVTIDYATAADAAGLHEPTVAHLRALASRAPLDERAHARLMVALAATGQQASALDVYESLRRRLDDELGVRPSRELTDAHLLVLREQVTTAGAAPGPGPAQTAEAAGAGGPAWKSPGSGGDPGPAGADRPVPRQLPAPVRHFAGRAAELKMLTGLLDQRAGESAGTVMISAIGGTAGVGKTALAVHWAHRVAERFPDGQLYLNLRGFDPSGSPVAPADATRRFLDALRVPASQIPSSAEAQQDLYRSLLASRRMLIVLDNARDAGQVRPLLPGGPRCLVLVTSRNQLTSLVAVEGAYPVTLDVLSPPECGELLVRHLGAERIAAEADWVTELTELCARLPLALAIAAARAAMRPKLPLATLVRELQNATGRLDALDTGSADVSARAVFSWSYQQLPTPTARMFRLLGIHPGPDISAPAAASLAGISLDQARQALGQLTRTHLLTEHTPGRFAFHDLLRAYAAERAAAEDSQPEQRAAIHRTLDHYLHTAYAAARVLHSHRDTIPLVPAQPGVKPEAIADYEHAMAWFDAEHRVVLAAIDQAVSAGFDTHGWQLPVTLTTFFDRRGYWHSYPTAQQTALASAQRLGDREAQALVHRRLGHASTRVGSYQDALPHYEQALDLYQELGDREGQARALLGLAFTYEQQGQYRQALDYCLQVLDAYQALGDRDELVASTLNNIGWCHVRLGSYQEALAYCQKALNLAQEIGHEHGEANAWDTLGYACDRLGRHSEAVACYQKALALLRKLDDHLLQAEILTHLGDAYRSDGKPHLAREAWQQALAIIEDLNLPGAEQIRDRIHVVKVAQSR